jgi:hypothetical protein
MHKRLAKNSSSNDHVSGTSFDNSHSEFVFHQIKSNTLPRQTSTGKNAKPMTSLLQLVLLVVVYSLLTGCCVTIVRSQETNAFLHSDNDGKLIL